MKRASLSITPCFLRTRASFVRRQDLRLKRRRSKRAVRLTRFSESPSLAVSALSKARTPRFMIRLSLMTAQPTDAMPISSPNVHATGADSISLSFTRDSSMLRTVVAIRGESRCYNKNRKIRIRKSPRGNPRALCFVHMQDYFPLCDRMTSRHAVLPPGSNASAGKRTRESQIRTSMISSWLHLLRRWSLRRNRGWFGLAAANAARGVCMDDGCEEAQRQRGQAAG